MPPTNCVCFYTKYSISGGSAGFHYQGDLRVLEGLRLNLRAAAVGNFWLTRLPLSPPPSPLSVTIHTMLFFNTVYFVTSVIRYLCYATIDVTTHPLIGHPYMISLSTGMYVTTFQCRKIWRKENVLTLDVLLFCVFFVRSQSEVWVDYSFKKTGELGLWTAIIQGYFNLDKLSYIYRMMIRSLSSSTSI